MPARSRLPFLAALVFAVPASAAAQARYVPTADTLRYESYNPYRMYWLAGADTVGPAVESRTVEAHVWRGGAERPEVVIRQVHPDLDGHPSTDSYTLSPQGQVLEINRRPPTGSQRIDLLLRLPAAELALGVSWTDTVAAGGMEPTGEQRYQVIRTYRVERMIDTLGSRVAEVAAEGAVRMRLEFWADSAAGRKAWIDVAGPVREEYSFDVTRGRLLRRFWTMDLRGRGVPATGGGAVPAGLRSDQEMRLTDAPRVRYHLATLPGADTAVTLTSDSRPILLHVIARAPGRISSRVAHNYASGATATATFAAGRVSAYEEIRVDSTPRTRARRITVRGDSLVLTRGAGRDTTLAIPAGAWAVADPAMQEMLAPVLLSLPRDGAERPLSVFRPHDWTWDRGTATARSVEGLVAVVVRKTGDPNPELMLFTPEGDYLFGQAAGPRGTTRIMAGDARRDRVMKALETLNDG